MAKTLVCIVGPTAVGKTALAIQVAQHFHTVILSADSRQFYREMTIGTAKPSSDELEAVPHYFINSHSITTDYSAGDFERDALELLRNLFITNDVVVLVGGSGLFVNAVCNGLDNLPKPLPGVRDRLNTLHRHEGLDPLRQRLEQVDPKYHSQVDLNNPQRIIRALEVYESTGMPFSEFRRKQTADRPFHICKIGLNTDREQLYRQINARADAMMESGLLQEVASLMRYRGHGALQTVGYAELFDYLDGNSPLQEAVDKIKQHTRRYAKRQITWFKKDDRTTWFTPDALPQIIAHIAASIQARSDT
ncbi:tRNA (adenosine(37)-N6)-dimethylallyltransferase MiaA [Parapedobacter deserti]|uniref:tRNA dimethylallyltransferase n=1 Tax=Parapedobacter deserti TaxID=1912957 RepID=A0ABV7JGP1_9SPHI